MHPDGICVVADLAPSLYEENDLALDIFQIAQKTAEVVDHKKKKYLYLRPADLVALMDIHDVEQHERVEMLAKLEILERVSNETRPAKKHRKPRGGRRGR